MEYMSHIKVGRICGDKVKYPDSISCCIWYPSLDDEDSGCCWDFAFEDINDLIQLLQQLKEIEPEIYEMNEDTKKVLQESEKGLDLHKSSNVDELMKDLESSDEEDTTEVKIDLTKHAGDCAIYSSLYNGRPEDGICTCGYGWKLRRKQDWSQMYSKELLDALEKRRNNI